ncbi:Coiled-coil domain-containing protein [Toxocara canis]|uniref:Cilia- and flagella-associated protein 36 n=1 Tax=Toxocara canis TaxID=6265 RepID=A0A0B2VYD8_TOXCA|nr:Coiled-coil domain-containing protein [Toxocara canis]
MLRRRSSNTKELTPKAIFKKFLDFLSSSIWNLPVATFIEQRSIAFERDQGDPALYKEIHKEFASMVDTLIECFCDDTHIKAEQLVAALKHQDNSTRLSLKERMLLEPVVAAQDFNVFVPMMMRKNVELQLQALQMIEFMCGLVPAVLRIEGEDVEDEELTQATVRSLSLDPADSDRYILVQVLRQSREDFEKDEANRKEAQMQLEAAMRESLLEKERLEAAHSKEEAAVREAMKRTLEEGMELTPTTPAATAPPQTVPVSPSPVPSSPNLYPSLEPNSLETPIKTKSPVGSKEVKKRPSTSKTRPPTTKERQKSPKGEMPQSQTTTIKAKSGKTAADIHAMLTEPTRIPSADIRARAEYLRLQRDKLLALKKAEREKVFQETAERSAVERPKTAKAARGVMSGCVSRMGPVNEDVLAARRALAYKLKNEIFKQ